jgi:hypothetical protein
MFARCIDFGLIPSARSGGGKTMRLFLMLSVLAALAACSPYRVAKPTPPVAVRPPPPHITWQSTAVGNTVMTGLIAALLIDCLQGIQFNDPRTRKRRLRFGRSPVS